MAHITKENIDDILVSAFEGGINYWCNKVIVVNNDYKGGTYASDVLTRGGALTLVDDEGDKHTITIKDIRTALELYRKQNGSSFDFDNHDAGDADTLVQLATFGELVYG